jgi:aryl-alcohol dehydrogenase-like predicted oxidoreductase
MTEARAPEGDAGPRRSAFVRGTLAAFAAATLGAPLHAETGKATTMQQRKIPSTGAMLPVIGCGTWQTFDVGHDAAALAERAAVLGVLFEAGGSVIDSSPMYGSSEQVVGDVLAAMQARDRAFIATKVWTRGRAAGVAQMERSLALLRTDHVELMQVHNLVDWQTQLDTLRVWKRERRIGHVGVTHYTPGAYGELEQVMRAQPLDFVQLNYAINDRAAEARLLPLAAARGIAVLVNQPFGGGGLLRSLLPRPLPGWAGEIGCTSWAQVLLKFVLSHPAVSCVIPGTGRAAHMRDNVQAGSGALPDAALRERMAAELA